ncbi:hypothetical protein QTP88_004699 [Uroleucon formosanum]
MVQEKMNDVLEKNEGYQTLAQISKILTGKETSMVRIPENLSLGNFAYFKYAPINSVDVERSFSMFQVELEFIQCLANPNYLNHIPCHCFFFGTFIA